jgi:hypothetical protein
MKAQTSMLRRNARILVWVTVVGVFGLIQNIVQAQSLLLIRNGSFESPSSRGISRTVPDYWTVTTGLVSLINTASASYAQYLPATDGSQVLLLYACSISQNVSLVSGEQYQLTFDLSPRQYDGSSPQDAYLNLSISDGAQVVNQSFFVPAGTTTWTQESLVFAADDSSEYVVSLDSPPLQIYMSIIDNVSMEAVPEPNVTALFGVSFFCAPAFAAKNHRSKSAFARSFFG